MKSRNGFTHALGRSLGALSLCASLAVPSFAQTVQPTPANPEEPAAARKKIAVEETAAKPADTIELSPFQVVADTKGYYSSNTMSGTRLNSKIEDLGQSITVMTKEQMSDFAMLDINDVFDYMASTEGTGSYSSFTTDRTGAVTDNVSLDPNNANRVRGIGNANIAFNNIAVSGRVAIDPLWIDALEVSRGPNANIFGLGNPAGTVNQVAAMANLSRDFARVEVRGDSYEGYRGSLDVNRVLVPRKLAVRASYAYQHIGFIRKPSGEDQRRASFQLKAQPFKNTTISLNYYNFKDKSQRPNYTTPRDFISSWIAAGRPAWNPVTRLITLNGVTYGQGMVAGSTTPITTLPIYFGGADARSYYRIGAPGETPYFTAPTVNTNTTSPLLNAVTNTVRFVQTTQVGFFGTAQPLFASPAAISDKSIYDWEEVNLGAMNRQWDDTSMYLAQLDQVFINTPKHVLAGQVTFMREDSKQLQNLPTGPASVNGIVGQIYADPNIVNLDGSPNPYFGRPYLKATEPFLRDRPLRWDTARAQLAYRLDFSQDKGLSKWLGTQQLLGYYEYKDQMTRHYAWRHTATSLNVPWIKALYDQNIPLASRVVTGPYGIAPGNAGRIYEQYYVGSAPTGVVQYAPNFFPEGATVPYVWGNTGAFNYDQTPVNFTPSPDGSGALASLELVNKTKGGVLQSNLLGGRLIATLGLRKDQVFSHNGVNPVLTADLRSFDYAASNKWLPGWRMAEGQTKTIQGVLVPFRDVRFFRERADSGTGLGKLFGEAVSSFRLTYNNSDGFIPQGPAVDLFLRPLPNQTGKSNEFGFWVSLIDNKLSIRYSHYKTDQRNIRNGDIATIAQRVLRADGLNAADPHNLQDRATEWVSQLNPGFTPAQVNAEVAKTMGLSQDVIDALQANILAGTLSATQDYLSKGDEMEINFNPTRAWTISASVTKTDSINQNAGNTIEEWIATRMPIWNSVEDPRFTAASPGAAGIPTGATGHLLWRYIAGTSFTAFNYNGTTSAIANYATFVEGPLAVYRQLEGRPLPQISKYSAKFNTRYNLSGMTDNKYLKNVAIGGSLRWVDKAAIGFYGVQSMPATITALDVNKPIYAPAQKFIDLFVTYNTKMFHDKIRAKFQLNVKNVMENGGELRMTQAFPDGTGLAYRIIDPRQFILSASFDL